MKTTCVSAIKTMNHPTDAFAGPALQPLEKNENGKIVVRITRSPEEILAAQRLRYKVFCEEFGAKPSDVMAHEGREFDDYDHLTDHLVVLDERRGIEEDRIVGTYRLLRREKLPDDLHFYTSQEFDITPLLKTGSNLLELGRSCVLPEYRIKPVIKLMWQEILDYVSRHNVDILFGCACLHGTQVSGDIAEQLSYLYHYHLAPEELCPRVLPDTGVDMNILSKDSIAPRAKQIFANLPPLIKGYLRIGCMIGNGAYIDNQFNSIDVCIVGQSSRFADRYVKHYSRKVSQKDEPQAL